MDVMVFNSDSEGECDTPTLDTSIADGKAAILKLMTPHLKDGVTNEELDKKLEDFGVSSMTHLKLLEESDMAEIMSRIQFRLFKKNLESGPAVVKEEKNYILNIRTVLPFNLFEELQGQVMLSKRSRKTILNLIGDDIASNMIGNLNEASIYKVARTLAKSYAPAFGAIRHDSVEFKEMALGLRNNLLRHAQYVRQTKFLKNPVRPRSKFSRNQAAGLDAERDNPSCLPQGETIESQEQKVEELLRIIHNKGNINWIHVQKLMGETYSTLRKDINDQILIEEIIRKWPFIGETRMMAQHFLTLKGVDMSSVLERQMDILRPWIGFFQYVATQKRCGKSKEIPEAIRLILLKYTKESPPGIALIVVVWCLFAHLSINPAELIINFNDTTTYDLVESSEKLPDHGKPVIAVLGHNIYRNPQCYIVIEKRCISTYTASLDVALHTLLHSYFIFKITYERPTAPIMEFLEMKLYGLQPVGHSRVARTKSKKGNWSHASPLISSKFTTLLKDFTNYINLFNFHEM